MSLIGDINQLAADTVLVHSWVQGGVSTTVAMGAGQVRSPAKLIADLDAQINQSAVGLLAQSVAQTATATAQAAAAVNAKTAAETARDQANAAWTAALAANPTLNSAVRMNPSVITADLTIPSFYNATSTGPIEIAEGVNVTINDNANWSIE